MILLCKVVIVRPPFAHASRRRCAIQVHRKIARDAQ